jgi:hypothetical protein
MNTKTILSSDNIWPASLGGSTVFGCLLLACIFPFAAFAALAALTMKPRSAIATLLAVWGVNQAIGFFVLSFPWDGQALGHGIAILAAMMLAYAAAKTALRYIKGNGIISAAAALAAAFAVQQLALRAYASFGGGAENFSTEIITAVGVENLFWFAGLLALRYMIAQMTGARVLAAA